ncbi:MAG: rhomboid family intramembrane serine protease [Lachnospiraceae bacterium]|jgi:rhomboid protease GluP|nr:rhomboid family intramembrane serine protease [Lachnospiraceae bacterium]
MLNTSFSWTYILIGINIFVFLMETLAGGSTKTEVARRFGAMYTPDLKRGQIYRLFTAMFLHFGVLHLLCNMYSLYNLGPALEYICGAGWYLIIYIGSGLFGNLFTWAAETRSGHYSVSAGASGAIFGLMGAYLVLALHPQYHSYFSMASILTNIGINLLYGFSNKSINMRAHLGGMIGGAVLMLLMVTIYL